LESQRIQKQHPKLHNASTRIAIGNARLPAFRTGHKKISNKNTHSIPNYGIAEIRIMLDFPHAVVRLEHRLDPTESLQPTSSLCHLTHPFLGTFLMTERERKKLLRRFKYESFQIWNVRTHSLNILYSLAFHSSLPRWHTQSTHTHTHTHTHIHTHIHIHTHTI
jgi:hypothetical protein